MAYKTTTIDLTAIVAEGNKQPVAAISADKPIGSVTVTKIAAGASFNLHLGDQDRWFIDGQGALVGISAPEDANRGLFFSNPVAQPGVIVELTVSFADRPA